MTGLVCLVEHNRPPGNTLDLVQVAQRTGRQVMVATSDPTAAAELFPADVEVVTVDTTDGAAIAAALRSSGVSALLSAHDFYVPAAADAAKRLGLPGPDLDAVRACRRKDSQRACLAEHGVPQPSFAVARSPREAVVAAERLGYPVVVKPIALADSIGVLTCWDADAVASHSAALAGDSRFRTRRPAAGHVPGEVLVESVLDGIEHTVEVFGGRALAVAQTKFAPPPGFVEMEHVVASPAAWDTRRRDELTSVAERAVTALGLGFGPVHVELRVAEGGPAVVEVNARLAGGRIPRLHQLTHGVDLWQAWLALVCGEEVAPVATHARAGVLRFVQVAGCLAQPTVPFTPAGFDGELVLTDLPAVGVRPTRSSEHAGWAIVTGSEVEECHRRLDDLWSELVARLPIWRPSVGSVR